MNFSVSENFFANKRMRSLLGAMGLIVAIFCVVVISDIFSGKQDALERAKLETESLTNSLTDHVEITFLSADINIRRAIERKHFGALLGENLKQYLQDQFDRWLTETPQLAALLFINDQGQIEIAAAKKSLQSWLAEEKPLDTDVLNTVMKNATQQDLFVGRIRAKDKEHIILARKNSHVNEEFAGVIAAIIPSGYFGEFYSTIAFGEKQFMAIELITNDKQKIFLNTGPSRQGQQYSTLTNALADIQKENIRKTTVGVNVVSVGDSIAVVGSRRLERFNVVVHVLLSSQDVFEDWNQDRITDLGFLILFLIFSSILSFFLVAMAKQTHRAEESENTAILASQAKSEFLANMSHELRTPLNAIIGYSEMMNSEYFGPMNQKQKDRIHDINLCGTHLLQLINDILEFSKGEAGKLELTEEKVDLKEIIGETIRISNAKARSKSIYLSHSLESDLPYIWADRRKLTQILLNLLTNAIKFTPQDGSVQISAYSDETSSIHVVVSDTGVGMREEDIPRAMSVFGQVHRNHDQEGTGLGLPLCKMYVELHGGKFIINSRLNAGTKVHILMPHQRSLTQAQLDQLSKD